MGKAKYSNCREVRKGVELEKIRRLFYFLFFFLPPLVFIPGTFNGKWAFCLYEQPKLWALHVLFWGLPILFFISGSRWEERLHEEITDKGFWLLLGIGGISVLTALWSVVPAAALYEAAQWLSLACIYLFLIIVFRDSEWRSLALRALCLSYALVTLIGFTQMVFDIPFLQSIQNEEGTWGSTFGAKNAYALSVGSQIFLVFLLAHRAWSRREFKAAAGWGAFLLMELFYLALSLSRTTYLAVVVGLLVLLMVLGRRVGTLRLGAVVVVALLLIVASLRVAMPSRYEFMERQIRVHMLPYLKSPGRFFTETVRGQVLLDSTMMISEHPEGVGAGNWQFLYPIYREHLTNRHFNTNRQIIRVHNDYVQMLCELGWGGGLLFASLLLVFPGSCLKRVALSLEKRGSRMDLAVILGQYAAILVMLFFSFYLEYGYRKFFLALLLALIASIAKSSDLRRRIRG